MHVRMNTRTYYTSAVLVPSRCLFHGSRGTRQVRGFLRQVSPAPHAVPVLAQVQHQHARLHRLERQRFGNRRLRRQAAEESAAGLTVTRARGMAMRRVARNTPNVFFRRSTAIIVKEKKKICAAEYSLVKNERHVSEFCWPKIVVPEFLRVFFLALNTSVHLADRLLFDVEFSSDSRPPNLGGRDVDSDAICDIFTTSL